MNTEILIPLGIFLVAFLIILASIAYVLKGVLVKSAHGQEEIRREFPWLLKRGFRFQQSAGPFALIVAGRLLTGIDLKLHFRLPGRGYTGGVQYNGTYLYLLQLSNFQSSELEGLSKILNEYTGTVTFQSNAQLQWQPTERETSDSSLELKSLIEKLENES